MARRPIRPQDTMSSERYRRNCTTNVFKDGDDIRGRACGTSREPKPCFPLVPQAELRSTALGSALLAGTTSTTALAHCGARDRNKWLDRSIFIAYLQKICRPASLGGEPSLLRRQGELLRSPPRLLKSPRSLPRLRRRLLGRRMGGGAEQEGGGGNGNGNAT